MKIVLIGISLAACLMASSVHAQDSLANASKASTDSAVAIGEMTEAGVKVVGGAVALPVAAVGMVVEGTGKALHYGSKAMWDSAQRPLEITPQTVTAQPAPQVPYDRAPRQTSPVSPASQDTN